MKYTLLKKWHESQVEEVGHVFERTYQNCIYYKHRDEEYLSEEVVAPHEIALLVHAGYLKEEKKCMEGDHIHFGDTEYCKKNDTTLDLWTEEPAKGTQCWFVTDYGDIEDTYFCGETKADQFRFKTNNCHKTKQSAEEALKRLLS